MPELVFPGVFRAAPLDIRAKDRRSLRGIAPAGSAGGCIRRGISRRRSPLHSGKNLMRHLRADVFGFA